MNLKEELMSAINNSWQFKENLKMNILDNDMLSNKCEQIAIRYCIEVLNDLERNTKGVSAVSISEIEDKIKELKPKLTNQQ